jgi:hypothetical protein
VESYPINLALRVHGPRLFAQASRTMTRVRTASCFGRQLTLFEKPVR